MPCGTIILVSLRHNCRGQSTSKAVAANTNATLKQKIMSLKQQMQKNSKEMEKTDKEIMEQEKQNQELLAQVEQLQAQYNQLEDKKIDLVAKIDDAYLQKQAVGRYILHRLVCSHVIQDRYSLNLSGSLNLSSLSTRRSAGFPVHVDILTCAQIVCRTLCVSSSLLRNRIARAHTSTVGVILRSARSTFILASLPSALRCLCVLFSFTSLSLTFLLTHIDLLSVCLLLLSAHFRTWSVSRNCSREPSAMRRWSQALTGHQALQRRSASH